MGIDSLGGLGGGAVPFSNSEVDPLAEFVPLSEGELDRMDESGEYPDDLDGSVIPQIPKWLYLENQWSDAYDPQPEEGGSLVVLPDLDRDKMYSWDFKQTELHPQKPISDLKLREIINGWAKDYGVAPLNLYRADPGMIGALAEYGEDMGDGPNIFFSTGLTRDRLLRVAAHEFAHHVTTVQFGGRFNHESHGPEFMKHYTDVLERYGIQKGARQSALDYTLRVG